VFNTPPIPTAEPTLAGNLIVTQFVLPPRES
jgi:hypothetical protein